MIFVDGCGVCGGFFVDLWFFFFFNGFPVGLWSGCLVGLRWLFAVGLWRIFGGFARVAVGAAWRELAVGRGFGLWGDSLSLDQSLPQPFFFFFF